MTTSSAAPESKPPSLLAGFAGERPPAPVWFDHAIAQQPERTTFSLEGATIELLTWGRVGAPGLLLLHGGMAHADWWSFIAPYFAATHRVAALSWSGMGRSSWRARYAVDQFVAEARAAMDAARLHASTAKPLVIGHSFGGIVTMRLAHQFGADLGGVLILDAPVETPEHIARRAERRKDDKPPRDTRIYASEAEALARFRFSPPQTCEHAFLVDWIARNSLRQIRTEQATAGWTWRFDPFLWSRLARADANADLAGARCRVAMLWGGASVLFPATTVDFVRKVAPRGTLFVEIPDAGHHVMVDQPHALVATARAVMAAWQ
jgi:pimeloyl-ACP methyl ester carboxylesterase